jgi:hypothetical protein
VGDLIITRRNDRRLRISPTDWVKNGDRWIILGLTGTRGLRMRHVRNGRIVTLPDNYVETSAELGYATTVHAAQGVTADTMHGVVTGEESRQQFYTMLTRGRGDNHVYVSVVGDGDPHAVLQPDNLHLRTATDVLEQILARDASPQSASTQLREQHDPAVRLGAATARYLDALYVAAEHLARPEMIANLDQSAERLLGGGLTSEPAWPTIRRQIMLAAAGAAQVTEPYSAAKTRDMTSADDHVAAIDWPVGDVTGVPGGGPLPWLPGIPHRLAADPNWGQYLNARSQLVAQLANQIRGNATAEAPAAWVAARPHALLSAELIADTQVWRAATQVEPSDMRPTGPPQPGYAARLFQQQLDKRLAATDTRTESRWRHLLAAEVPSTTADPFLPELTERLSNLTRSGYDATHFLRSAAAGGPLPDDHPAAAIWWRILDQLPQTQPATPKAVPATRRRGPTLAVRRSRQPPTFGPSR